MLFCPGAPRPLQQPAKKIGLLQKVRPGQGRVFPTVVGHAGSVVAAANSPNVEGIEHIESHSYYGSSIIKIFLQPGVDCVSACNFDPLNRGIGFQN